MAKRPIGVTILAVLIYIGAAILLLSGIAMLIGSTALASLVASVPGAAILGALGATAFIIGGIVMIALGVLYFLVGRGMWNGKNWARIVALVLSVIGVIMAIVPLNIVSLVINAVIIWYLGFNKTAKAYFR